MDSCMPVRLAEAARVDDARWELAGRFLDALLRRDFGGLQACLHHEVRCQVLEPSGGWSFTGAPRATNVIRAWFGTADHFEVHDAAIGEVGSRVYLRWRIVQRHLCASEMEVIEQHVFVTLGHRIVAMDLLSSGVQTQATQPRQER